MEFLFSNLPPLNAGSKTFYDSFYKHLSLSTSVDIAVGYVTADSLSELKNTIELNNYASKLNLIIGMHYYEKFTQMEYQAAVDLNTFLKENHLGSVDMVTAFRYHGKLYAYSNKAGAFAGIIGSNNLSSIVDKNIRIYEASFLLNEPCYAQQMQQFIIKLRKTSCKCIDGLDIHDFKQQNKLLENHEHVEKVTAGEMAECLTARTSISFKIPIKAGSRHTKSNLNTFHGKGREGANGLIISRHWYEVELIVPQDITSQPDYPKAGTDSGVINVITDDGWKFTCKVSGDYSKNLRSEGDLKILGKWLKGRLENKGALKVGNLVTEETLAKYGRGNFSLTKTSIPDLWYLDFSV